MKLWCKEGWVDQDRVKGRKGGVEYKQNILYGVLKALRK